MKKIFNSPFRVTQSFGARPDYYIQFGLAGHEGIDLIPSDSNWNIYSFPFTGTVVRDIDMGDKGGAYGNHITIWYPEIKKAFMYCHLKENYVDLGQTIIPGSIIGLMGATGNTQGAHLHLNMFEVDDQGVRLNRFNGFLGGIDPYSFLIEDVPNQPIPEGEDMPSYLKTLFQERNINPETQESLVRELFDKGGKYDSLKNDLENCMIANSQQAKLIESLRVDVDKLTKQLSECLKNTPNSADPSWDYLISQVVQKLKKIVLQ